MKEDFDYKQMLAGDLYIAGNILPENKSIHGKKIVQKINNTPIEQTETIVVLERQVFGKTGNNLYVTPPFQVDYGRHVEIGNNFYANMDCIFRDVNKIIIGDNVILGPRFSFYTAGLPIDAEIRIEELEFGLPITIEDNVWIGGSATILPGVTVGRNSIVAAGAVVTKDVPSNSIVGGNPARLIRVINQDDKQYWNKKKQEYQLKIKEK